MKRGPDVDGLSEGIRRGRKTTLDDREQVVERVDAFIEPGRSVGRGHRHGRDCEGSVWYGALHHKLPSGGTIDVFKSWAERRRADPTRILLERRSKHPLISRSTIKAARALRPHQGHDRLYFSGQYTHRLCSQESAVYSAMKVAESLAPGSRTLGSLKTLLAARGRAGISYDL
jgi:predicted NAD/FAD-binding protein